MNNLQKKNPRRLEEVAESKPEGDKRTSNTSDTKGSKEKEPPLQRRGHRIRDSQESEGQSRPQAQHNLTKT